MFDQVIAAHEDEPFVKYCHFSMPSCTVAERFDFHRLSQQFTFFKTKFPRICLPVADGNDKMQIYPKRSHF